MKNLSGILRKAAKVGIAFVLAASFNGYALAHEHHAPHKGTLVEFGEEFAHLELVLDGETGKLSAYALDGEAENPVRLKQESIDLTLDLGQGPQEIKLAAMGNPLTGEVAGDSSEFAGQADFLKKTDHFKGSVKEITIRGKEFTNVGFSFPGGNE